MSDTVAVSLDLTLDIPALKDQEAPLITKFGIALYQADIDRLNDPDGCVDTTVSFVQLFLFVKSET